MAAEKDWPVQAERKFGDVQVSAKLASPTLLRGGTYLCEFEIEVDGHRRIGVASGIDSLQSVIHGLSNITRSVCLLEGSTPNIYRESVFGTSPIALETEFLSVEVNDAIFDAFIQSENEGQGKASSIVRANSQKEVGKNVLPELCRRSFLFEDQAATVAILNPVEREGAYYCAFVSEGIPLPNADGSYGDTALQALFLCYFTLWMHLTSFGAKIHWTRGPKGCAGLPICLVGAGRYGADWDTRLAELILEKAK